MMLSLVPHPADQFGLSEVLYVSPNYFSIHFSALLFVGLHINQPYFFVIIVPYHSLFRIDHFDTNIPQISAFHFFSKQYISVAVSVEKKYPTLSNVLNVLRSSPLLHQKHEWVVEGSEHILNFCVLLSEADRNRFFLKHQSQSIIYLW